MPKARASVSRVVVASPASRDDVASAPSTDQFRLQTGRASGRVSPHVSALGSFGSSNVRSSPRSRVPLGDRDPGIFLPSSGALTPNSPKKSSRARHSSPPSLSSAADLSASLTAPAARAPMVASAPAPLGPLSASATGDVGRLSGHRLAFPATFATPSAVLPAPTPYRDAVMNKAPIGSREPRFPSSVRRTVASHPEVVPAVPAGSFAVLSPSAVINQQFSAEPSSVGAAPVVPLWAGTLPRKRTCE